MSKILDFMPPTTEAIIENFAIEFNKRGTDCLSSMTLVSSNRLFQGLNKLVPSHVAYVCENFCDLDFGKVSLEQNYFGEELALDYLSQFCSEIQANGATSIQDISDIEFLRGYVALCQILLANVSSIRRSVKNLRSNAGIPETLIFARVMSFPLIENPGGNFG